MSQTNFAFSEGELEVRPDEMAIATQGQNFEIFQCAFATSSAATYIISSQGESSTAQLRVGTNGAPESQSTSTLHDLFRERAKRKTKDFLLSESFSNWGYSDRDPVEIDPMSRIIAIKMIDSLPADRCIPRVAPDGEGDIMLVWGNPPLLLITVEKDTLYTVIHPATKRSKHLSKCKFSSEVLPSEICKYIPFL